MMTFFNVLSAQDYSAFGSRLSVAGGKTLVYMLTLLRSILDHPPDIFIHENVENFPKGVIYEILSTWLCCPRSCA
jgi:hypothetical protein